MRIRLGRGRYELGATGLREGRHHGEEASTSGHAGWPRVSHRTVVHGFFRPFVPYFRGPTAYLQVFDRGLALCHASGNRTGCDRSRQAWALPLGALRDASLRVARYWKGDSESLRTGALLGHTVRVVWLSEVCRLAGTARRPGSTPARRLDLARQHEERANEALSAAPIAALSMPTPHFPLMPRLSKPTISRPSPLPTNWHAPLQAHCHQGLGTLYATTGRGAGPRQLPRLSSCIVPWTWCSGCPRQRRRRRSGAMIVGSALSPGCVTFRRISDTTSSTSPRQGASATPAPPVCPA